MKEKILITVKTYPTISRKYNELVCTAGLREDGTWVRIYPVPFRKLFEPYVKFQWVEADLIRSDTDPRPESHKLLDPDSIRLLDTIDTRSRGGWETRRNYVISRGKVYHNLSDVIALNKQGLVSLATFKPTSILDLKVDKVDRNWDPDKLEALREHARQGDMFEDAPRYFEVVSKLPYKFSYRLKDNADTQSTMMISDWEIGMLFWKCLERHDGNEEAAIEDVRKKYIDDFARTRDLHLFLGTTQAHDRRAPNPFIIIGVFAPPKERQQSLL